MIRFLLRFYTVLLMIDAILSYFPQTNRYEWRAKLRRICEYTCAPVRRFLPIGLAFDFSPIVVIFFIYIFIEVFSYLW